MLVRIVLLMLLLLPMGCFQTSKISSDLPELTDKFCEAMRWKDFSTAAGYMTATVQDDFNQKFIDDKDLYVVGSKIRHVTLHVEEHWAEALYVLEYYRLPSSRIKEWHWRQRWEAPKEEGASSGDGWKITEPAPPVPWQ